MVILPTLPEDYLTGLPKVDDKDLRILWHCNFYDGPRSGVVLYRGNQPCWFEIQDQDADFRSRVDDEGERWNDWYARFVLVELTDEQFTEEARWNELFRQKVGTHWDYDALGRHKGGKLRPTEMWHEFYDAAAKRSPQDLSNNAVIGWFEWLWASAEDED